MKSNELRDKLNGPIVAMTTHFKKDGSVDLDAMRLLTNYYISAGIQTVIVTGSTGQFITLSDEERGQVQKAVIDAAAGRLTVIAGTSDASTQTTVDLTKKATDLGADAVMITPPYGAYNGGGFECLRKHYDTVTRQTDIAIVIYFSGNVMHLVPDIMAKPEMMLDLADSCNGKAGGFKDSSGNFPFYRDVSQILEGKIAVMGSAGMNYFFFGYHFGSPCFLTGLGNIWPTVELEFYRHMVAGKYEDARKIVIEKDLPYLRATMKTRRYWACLHAMLEMVGLPGGHVRQPLLDVTPADREMLKQQLIEIGLMNVPVRIPSLAA